MSEQTSQEPTMEEILASIRRIISEDDAPAADPADTPPAATEEPGAMEADSAEDAPETAEAEPEPEPEPVEAAADAEEPADEPEEDMLELTDKVETHGDLDVYTPSAAEPEPPAPAAEAPAVAAKADEPLVSDRAADSASAAFGQLSAAILMPAHGRTLEDVVRELLRPLLQQWLDDNLPTIVQQTVESEVDRIARRVR